MIVRYEGDDDTVAVESTLAAAEAIGCTVFRCGQAGAVWEVRRVDRVAGGKDRPQRLVLTLIPCAVHSVPLEAPVLELPLPRPVYDQTPASVP